MQGIQNPLNRGMSSKASAAAARGTSITRPVDEVDYLNAGAATNKFCRMIDEAIGSFKGSFEKALAEKNSSRTASSPAPQPAKAGQTAPAKQVVKPVRNGPPENDPIRAGFLIEKAIPSTPS